MSKEFPDHQYVEKYREYLKDGDSGLVTDLFAGAVGWFAGSNYGVTGFILGFILLHILGFVIHVYNLDKVGDENPIISKAKEV